MAFVSTRDGGNNEIYVMSTTDGTGDGNGDNLARLTNNAAFDLQLVWSPDGSKLAFTRLQDNSSDISMMNADGSEQKRLTKKAAFNEHPAWSPDGKKIVFQSARGVDYEIYIMKARPESKRNRRKNLTKNDVGDNASDWRPLP